MKEIKANTAYFIKLGEKGKWVDECISTHKIMFGFQNPLHSACLKGEWNRIYQYWIREGKAKGKATEIKNETKTFYESDEKTLWITFSERKMYWCFANKKVIRLRDGKRIRRVKDKWSCEDIQGEPLTLDNLSGKLTKVQGFQGTICSVKQFEYLLNKINHKKLPEVTKAEDTLSDLKQQLQPIIQHLTWKDFEILIDLIFSYAGWQRLSALGKGEKSIDLDLASPVSGNRAFVQIKSQSTLKEFEHYINQYKKMKEFNEMYFVVHTTNDSFRKRRNQPDIKFWDVERISELVVNSGLVNWVIKKAS